MATPHAALTPTALSCPDCNGFGSISYGRKSFDCDRCHGAGHVACETRGCDEPATRTDDGLTFCEACGKQADEDVAAWIAAGKPCGVAWAAAKEAA